MTTRKTPPEIRDAAKALLAWHRSLDDGYVQATAIAQAVETAQKASRITTDRAAIHRAFVDRYLESLSLDNPGMLGMLRSPTPTD